jgi:plastocyanin
MVRWRLVAVVGGAIVALMLAGSVYGATASVKITEASERYHFTPATIFVHVGDTVTWTNTTDAPHTVTSNSGSELGSSTLAQNATYSHTFTATGSFAYHCTVHRYMQGTVRVLAAGATPPATTTAPAPDPSSGSSPRALLIALAFVLGLAVSGFLILGRQRSRHRRRSSS